MQGGAITARSRARSSRERGPGISVRRSIALVVAIVGQRTRGSGSRRYARAMDDFAAARPRSARPVRARGSPRPARRVSPQPEAMTLATATQRRRAVGPDGAAEGPRRARLRLLHEPREPQGRRARRRTRARRSCSTGTRPASVRCGSRDASEELDDDASAAYFATRPHGSTTRRRGRRRSHGPWPAAPSSSAAMRSSRRASGRATCRCRRSGAATVVIPDALEFWQGREHRFHDRVRYEREPRAGSENGLALEG